MTLAFFLHLFIFICVGMHLYHGTHVEVRGQMLELVLSSTIWVPKIKLKEFGLVISAFTHWTISGPPWSVWRVLASHFSKLSPPCKFIQNVLVNYIRVIHLKKAPHRTPVMWLAEGLVLLCIIVHVLFGCLVKVIHIDWPSLLKYSYHTVCGCYWEKGTLILYDHPHSWC